MKRSHEAPSPAAGLLQLARLKPELESRRSPAQRAERDRQLQAWRDATTLD